MGGAYLQNITGGPESTWCTSVYNWALYCRCKWLCRKLFKSVQRVHEIGITGSMGPQTPVKMITMSWRRLPDGGYCATHIVHYDHRPLDLNDGLILWRFDGNAMSMGQDRQNWHLNLTFQVTCGLQLSQLLRCLFIFQKATIASLCRSILFLYLTWQVA